MLLSFYLLVFGLCAIFSIPLITIDLDGGTLSRQVTILRLATSSTNYIALLLCANHVYSQDWPLQNSRCHASLVFLINHQLGGK